MNRKTFLMLALMALATPAVADQSIDGYIRQDGSYVQPYYRTEPNQNRFDNYSSQGNTNPYTGQMGHQRNEYSSPPAYNTGNGWGNGYQTQPRQRSGWGNQ